MIAFATKRHPDNLFLNIYTILSGLVVSKIKATGDASALPEAARELQKKYLKSNWAKKASVCAAQGLGRMCSNTAVWPKLFAA
ncbi:MAG TPA: hypothetical protein VGN39_15415 [Terriglobales bacterium]|jgi:Na+/H+ antiporter NhaB|nr:hypothetical protein [Terriglobales bacterium]